MALVAERMDNGVPRLRNRSAGLRPAPARLDLAATGDEQAARIVADLCLEALALRL